MSTMAGIGPSSSDFRERDAEPVYLLTRRRSSVPPPPVSSPVVSALPVGTRREVAVNMTRRSAVAGDDVWDGEAWRDDADENDDDVSDVRVVNRLTRRRRGIRFLGALAIIGTLAGGTYVLQQPKVRHEALSFVTMGHEDAAVRMGRRIASVVEAIRHR